jgi:hypothetical protein
LAEKRAIANQAQAAFHFSRVGDASVAAGETDPEEHIGLLSQVFAFVVLGLLVKCANHLEITRRPIRRQLISHNGWRRQDGHRHVVPEPCEVSLITISELLAAYFLAMFGRIFKTLPSVG